MKKTQVIELLSNIRATAVSFFSILMFVALGVAIFLGILWTAPALYRAADVEFDQGDFQHFQVIYPYGLTDADVQQLAKVEGVTDVEPAYSIQQDVQTGGQMRTVKFQSLPQRISVPTVLEGSLPSKAGEVAILQAFAEGSQVKVGDKLELVGQEDAKSDDATDADAATDTTTDATGATTDDASATTDAAADSDAATDATTSPNDQQFLNEDTFTVTAIVKSPEYISASQAALGNSTKGSGMLDGVVYAPAASFNPSAFQDAHPQAYVRAQIDADSTFYDEYDVQSRAIQERIESLGATLAKQRYTQLHDDAQHQIDDGQAQLDEAKQQIDEGQQQIDEGQQQLDAAKQQLEQGESQLQEKQQELADGQAKIAEGEQQLAQGQQEFDAKSAEAQQRLDEAAAQLNDGYAQLDEGYVQLEQAQQELALLDGALSAVDDGISMVDNGVQTAADEKARLDKQLADGKINPQEYTRLLQSVCDRLNGQLAQVAQALAAVGVPLNVPTVTPQNFDSAIAQINQATASIEDTGFTFNGQTYTLAQARELQAQLQQQVQDGQQQLADAEAELARLRQEYDNAVAQVQRELGYAQAQLDDGSTQLDSAKQQEAQGEQLLAEGQQQLADGRQEIADKTAELEQGKQQLQQGQQELAQKEEQLQQGIDQLAHMAEYKWSVMPRKYNAGTASAAELGKVTTSLSTTMAMLFVIVGLLVSYSAVSRIVHEQVVQIGTKKALGLRGREITASFLAYSGLAVLVGSVVGVIVAVVVVEGIIDSALYGRFRLGEYPPYFNLPHALAAAGIELVLVLGATWFACRSILKKQATQLLRGEEPPKARERFFERWKLWNRLPLFSQTIVSNCMNDKRRVFSTVVGVAGSTALIVTALMLNNDVLKTYDHHYSDVYGFDTVAYADGATPQDAKAILDAATKEGQGMGCTQAQVMFSDVILELPNGSMGTVRMVVPDDADDFAQVYHVNPVTNKQFRMVDWGVWVTRAYSEHFGVEAGDELVIDAADGVAHRLPIAGFYDFGLTFHEVVMSRVFYEAEFQGDFKANALLLNRGDNAFDEVKSALSGVEGITQVVDDKEYRGSDFRNFANISRTVVMVYLALAVLMAVVVLLNLNIMFIDEKKRELIVLMINGFSVGDAKRYIYNDSIVLTVLGIALGIVLGTVMGASTVAALEPATASFVKAPDAMAIGVGIVGSAILAAVMAAIALRRIPNFSLTDINKL